MMDSDQFSAIAARIYPSLAPTKPAEAPAPAPALAAPETLPEASGGQPEGKDYSHDAIAERLYGDRPEWSGHVDLAEPPPATAAEYRLDTPGDLADLSDTGRAAEGRVRDAFLAVGAPPSLATEIWNDAVSAQRGVFRPQSAASAEAELRQRWGDSYDRRMVEVKAVVRQVAAVSPEAMPFLERTGLCNNAKFLAKISAFASRRPKGV